uniref:Charged multivesicular body protein 5 n=2 Tax=Eukaryota TaxID=2759 RepID=A0A7S1HQ88_9EUKA|mmetsp:Transcript_10348/g.26542  ORF Transcript_10348/g.26542 Transcript_10348/m.26542 type:complete len:229 (+) Transcript_10348:220-906(+)
MKRIFGVRKEKAPPPSLDDATTNINARGDNVDARIAKLDQQLAKYKAQISKMRPGASQDAVKRRALVILKQKRMYEGQREQLYQQSFNLENAAFAAQNIKDNITQVQAMKAAHKDFKKAFKAKELDIDYIDNMQDDMMDMMEMTNEINESLGRTYAVPDDVDESDLMDELDALELELGDEEAEGAEGEPSYLQDDDIGLPSAPTGETALPGEEAQEEAPAEPIAANQN